jgi:FixJ family two-component response regulator
VLGRYESRAVCKLAREIQISIVDDDEQVRVALGRLMKAHGFLVETFESGGDLLGSEHLARTDCLIADVQMPGMSGLELHGRLIAASLAIPTILITGHPDDDVRSRALQAGVFRYLTKPVDGADLLGCVHSALGESEGNGRAR